jgi:hypothetical protein
MMKLLHLLKTSRLYQALVAFVLLSLSVLGLLKKGGRINQAKVEEERRKRDEATRKRRDEVNEKINSSDSFVDDWLRDHNRFRD